MIRIVVILNVYVFFLKNVKYFLKENFDLLGRGIRIYIGNSGMVYNI